MNARLAGAVALSLMAVVGTASGADVAKPSRGAANASAAQAADPSYAHGGQFNARVEGVFGFKMLFRYDKSPRCAPYEDKKEQQKFCGFGAPPAIGVALGFAPVGFFEPYLFGRFGLGNEREQTNLGKMVLVGAGVRLYTMSDSAFKIFFAPWLGFDFTSGPVDPEDPAERALGLNSDSYRTDFLVGLQIGPQYDVSKWLGIYAAGGLSFDVLRYLGAVMDLSFGVQLRAP
jgi:hypothetical protein